MDLNLYLKTAILQITEAKSDSNVITFLYHIHTYSNQVITIPSIRSLAESVKIREIQEGLGYV